MGLSEKTLGKIRTKLPHTEGAGLIVVASLRDGKMDLTMMHPRFEGTTLE